MNPSYELSWIRVPEEVPDRKFVSAVFLIGFVGDQVLAARNERGWDVPGGHLQKCESILEGLQREVEEEAGATFARAVAIASLSQPGGSKVMVYFAAGPCNLGRFVPQKDALERKLLSPNQLVTRYHGDRRLLLRLIERAKVVLAPKSSIHAINGCCAR